MAQLHRLQRNSNSTNNSPRTKTPTVQQFLQGESSAWPGTASPTLLRDHDSEFDHPHQHKQSVLDKVKEKARRWRQTLSKKKRNDTPNSTPSWGVSLEDEEDAGEDDPEYLGAPMYESELAPQGYKDTISKPHLRAEPAIPEKPALRSSLKDHHTKPGMDIKKSTATGHNNPPNMTLISPVSKKPAPAYNAIDDATTAMASKIQNISITALTQARSATSSSPPAPASAPAATKHSPRSYDAPVSAPARATRSMENSSAGNLIWDKGVSVKEYLKQKLEPGEDERALSQVISDAISPRRAPGDAGVVEKVREAVTSLLRKEESSAPAIVQPAIKTSSSPQIPISTNPPEEVLEDQSIHGRVLQTN